MDLREEIQTLSDEIKGTREILTALGDETASHIDHDAGGELLRHAGE